MSDTRIPVTGCAKERVDLVHQRVIRKIEAFKLSSFKAFATDIELRGVGYKGPSTQSNLLVNENGQAIGLQRYQLTFGSKSILVVLKSKTRNRLRIRPDQESNKIVKWVSIEDFLQSLDFAEVSEPYTDDHPVLRAKSAVRFQQDWWKQNGKFFKLLELPAEIRDTIYKYVLEVQIDPCPLASCRRLGKSKSRLLAKQPAISILRLNKQVHKEASDILHIYGRFYFEHLSIVVRFLWRNSPVQHLKAIHLSLGHQEYLELFGISLPRGDAELLEYEGRCIARRFTEIDLNTLEINFRSQGGYCEDEFFHGACQTTMVALILKAAWPFIRGQPVKLTGHIKKSQKLEFEETNHALRKKIGMWQKFNVEMGYAKGSIKKYFAELDVEEGGVLLDTEAEILVNEVVDPTDVYDVGKSLECVDLSGGRKEKAKTCAPGKWCDRE
ncbi:hypothetical protein MBLNU230_g2603t1 [Neophaeotheca triangularis]